MDFNELLTNRAFLEKVKQAQSLEEIVTLFAKEGITVTEEDIRNAMAEPEADENGEFSEDELDAVAGGASNLLTKLKKLLQIIGGPIKIPRK